jgi:hypothetical protein
MRLFATPLASAVAFIAVLMATYCLLRDVANARWIMAAALLLAAFTAAERLREMGKAPEQSDVDPGGPSGTSNL